MHVVEVSNGVSGYPALLSHVLRHGRSRSPRGIPTIEAGPTTVVMHEPERGALPLGTGRNVNRSIAAAEALQLVGGFSAPELLPKSFEQFKEPDGTFWGAYGERIGEQLFEQLDKLRRDPATRQSVLTLWSPDLDNQSGKRDYPCTVALMFWIDDGRLCQMTTMRSQDVWLGTPFDWFQFVQLHLTACRLLGVKSGIYRHMTASTHLYERDVEKAQHLVSTWYDSGGPADKDREWQPIGFGVDAGTTPEHLRWRCQNLREYGQGWQTLPEDTTESEMWYADNLQCFGEPTGP